LNENDASAPTPVLEQSSEANDDDVPSDKTENVTEPASKAASIITADSYKDENIEITIEKTRAYDTDVYIADIRIGGIEYLKSAFARNTYGRNINEKTSVIAERKAAILAINGDFYGFRDSGWVLRNGVVYRTGHNDTALLMDMAGSFSIGGDRAFIESRVPELRQIWSFGPPLVVNSAIAVSEHQEISGRSSISNPRTAIGQAGDLHYVFIVSDGRTSTSAGLSLYELAAAFRERGCAIAYNLDGGGSSAMYFNGRIVNRPTTGGNRIMEREVSDIVYIGY
jgi:exopolysaccharide biosynthesis protein